MTQPTATLYRRLREPVLHLVLAALAGVAAAATPPAAVNAQRLLQADQEPGNWMSHGRTYDEQRHSPLVGITPDNVGQLGLAWSSDLNSPRGTEATPLVVDGVMYVSAAYSVVHALDARSGKTLWTYDPQVPKDWVAKACCGPVNRGVAVWQGKVYVGTLDGRLVALDAATGKVAWHTLTVERSKPYTITGAPRVVKGLVLIGNGGAELGVRGYVTAYDAATGRQRWRFYTVPGNPAWPFESPALKMAAKTWTGSWWKLGGGGTVWDSMAYDAELDLLYIGVGNGSPWNQKERSPGGGDNLFLSSIVALRPSTGAYVWHYQTTPGDEWDYTATQHMILADLSIDGKPRKVLMQAPKNGFFYVLDRTNGALISAKNYAPVNWASGIDPKTGRPIEHPDARYSRTGKLWLGAPGPGGAHSWSPMSYSPRTGLVYLPVMEGGFPYLADAQFKAQPMGYNVGVDFGNTSLPADPAVRAGALAAQKGLLVAWNPVTQQEAWRVQQPGLWNGGVLSTASNLVFQGNGAGQFRAYQAEDGRPLWHFDGQSGIQAAPITYTVAGEQYVSVLTGRDGVMALAPGELAMVTGQEQTLSRVLTFKLGGQASLPALPVASPTLLNPPTRSGSEQQVAQGKALYGRYCAVCHGDAAVSGRVVPDLRASALLTEAKLWRRVVLEGALRARGMAAFASVLTPQEAEALRAYVIARAHEDRALEQQGHHQPASAGR